MGQPEPGGGLLTFQCFFYTCDWMGFRGVQDGYFATTRRNILQPRGGKICNHEEEKIRGFRGISRVGELASPWMLNCRIF